MTTQARIAAGTIQLAIVTAFFGLWTLLTQMHAINPLFLPALPTVGVALARLVVTPVFWSAVAVTAATTAVAYVLAVVFGIGAGFVIGRSPVLTRALEPVISGVFAIPIALFFPMFVIMFGIGPPSKIAFGAVYGFFPIALNTIAAFTMVDPLFLRAARSLGASRAQIFRHVYFPGALPVIVTGLRIGFFICFASVLGGETLSSASGVGHQIARQGELLNSGPMYAWIVIVLVATIAMNLALTGSMSRVRQD
ncbi:MAG TPA: ABC transporter permease subunit [Candidatus Binatia bacterium]|nr:ABC transporter permease subunit [Candidatus Binatia bacterium]